MLKIRLKRIGRKNRPFYRIVLIEARRSTKGKAIEILGHFNPRDRENTIILKEERIKYWLSQGAQASPVLNNILVDKGVIKGPKVKATKVHKKAGPKEGEKEGGAKESAASAKNQGSDSVSLDQASKSDSDESKKEEKEPQGSKDESESKEDTNNKET